MNNGVDKKSAQHGALKRCHCRVGCTIRVHRRDEDRSIWNVEAELRLYAACENREFEARKPFGVATCQQCGARPLGEPKHSVVHVLLAVRCKTHMEHPPHKQCSHAALGYHYMEHPPHKQCSHAALGYHYVAHPPHKQHTKRPAEQLVPALQRATMRYIYSK